MKNILTFFIESGINRANGLIAFKIGEKVKAEGHGFDIVVSQYPNVVVVQPKKRRLPGGWSTGYCNGRYLCAILGREAGLPGICESVGCCFITLCCCLAFNTYAFKARRLTQLRLGIPVI